MRIVLKSNYGLKDDDNDTPKINFAQSLLHHLKPVSYAEGSIQSDKYGCYRDPRPRSTTVLRWLHELCLSHLNSGLIVNRTRRTVLVIG